MRIHSLLCFSSIAFIACSSDSDSEPPVQSEVEEQPPTMEVAAPLHVTPDATAVVGVTSDDFAIYRGSGGIQAIKLEPGAGASLVSAEGGSISIRQNFVFLWANVDWTTMMGDLRIWNANQGLRWIGITLFGEDGVVAVDAQGETIMYYENVRDDRVDLMIARDIMNPTVLIADVGRGSEETCRANFRFVQASAFVAWCAPGSRAATLQRFDPPEPGATEWRQQTIASDITTTWSADSEGRYIFYVGTDYRGYVLMDGTPHPVDAGTSWGTMVNDGSAVLYTVGDQLRRTPLPVMGPHPVVTNGFAARAGWSPDMSHALYSTRLTYEGGTHRDLYLASTTEFNPQPMVLAPEPTATLSRSLFTTDGQHVLYLTNNGEGGTTLHVRSTDGTVAHDLPRVETLAAARGERVVFTDNRSNPDIYPIVADLRVLDPMTGEIAMLQERIDTAGTFHVTADGARVVFIRPRGVEAEVEAHGLYVQGIP